MWGCGRYKDWSAKAQRITCQWQPFLGRLQRLAGAAIREVVVPASTDLARVTSACGLLHNLALQFHSKAAVDVHSGNSHAELLRFHRTYRNIQTLSSD